MGAFLAWLNPGRKFLRHALSAAAVSLLMQPVITVPATASKRDDTLRVASEQTLPSLDKYFSSGPAGAIVSMAVWDTLFYRDPDSGEFKGDLARAWRWIDDRTLEIDLREGVRFHDGALFDADDVVYTLNFAADPGNKTLYLKLSWLDRVEKLGEYKVRLLTRAPFPAAIAYLATADIPIYPHAYYARVGPKGMNRKPIGTGPYRVTEHAVGKYVRFERNDDYFRDSPKPPPKIGKIEFRFVPDAQTRVAEAVAGSLDVVFNVERDQADQLRGLPNLQVISGEIANTWVLRMNTLPQSQAPQLRDLRVRQAIIYAIDRQAIARFLVGDTAHVLHAVCHPIEFGCDENAVPHYAYNPAKAKQLLAEAGYANGFDIDIYAYNGRTEVEAIVGYLGAVGIRAHLRYVQVGAISALRRSGKIALLKSGWFSQPLDASDTLSNFHEMGSSDLNRDPEVRDLLKRGDSSMDPNIRKQAYAKALTLIQERAYALPLYSGAAYYVANKDLAFKPHTDGFLRFYEMSWK